MHALITGGAGFIGSHLDELLLAKGWEVTVIDNLSTGRYSNIAPLEANKRFHLIIDTVLNRATVEELVKKADVIFHLASVVGVKRVIDHPVETIETIVEGTSVILDLANRYRKPVLITSTSEVYGKGIRVPFTEEDDTVQGCTQIRRWAYANAKAMDEFLALAYWQETRLPVICVRLFNTVGPRQTGQYGMVVPRFVKQALKGEPITVYGDGTQSRCFCHVKDVVAALVKLIQTKAAFGQVINIGNPEEISMNDLAAIVKKLTHTKSVIQHIPYNVAYAEGFEDMHRRVPSIAKAGKMVGFHPTRTLTQILNDVIKSLK